MRAPYRRLTALTAAVALTGLAACGSSNTTSPQTISLAGNYTLQSYKEASNDLSALSTGTLTLTDTHYTVNVTVTGVPEASIADSGTYTATTSGTFSQTSAANGAQTTGTYTLTNGLLTVSLNVGVITVVQSWQKQ